MTVADVPSAPALLAAAPSNASADARHVDAENPWPGLWPFTEESEAYFNGRRAEAAGLARLVRRERLAVLHGQSGLGKSSLLMAGLFPLLRADDYLPVYVRLDHGEGSADFGEQIVRALLAACAQWGVDAPVRPPNTGLWEYLHGRGATFWSAKSRVVTPVLVIDQFEELFTVGAAAGGGRRARGFEAELAALVDNRAPDALSARLAADPTLTEQYDLDASGYRIVLGMREDYLAALDRLKSQMRLNLYSFFRLLPMNRGQALDAVRTTGGALIDDDAADAVVRFLSRRAGEEEEEDESTDARDDEVDPALLSTVCRELNERRQQLGRPRITADLLEGLSPRTILSGFYERSCAGLDPRVQAFVEEELLTASGFRSSSAIDDAERTPGVSRAALETLVQRRLLRVDTRSRPHRIELTHDVLTDVVKERRDRRRAAEAQEEERRILVAREAEAQRRAAADRARAAAARGRARGYFTVAAVFVALGAWATVEGVRARAAAAAATQAAARATTATARANRALGEANVERARADSLRAVAERGAVDLRRLNAAMRARDRELQRTVDAMVAAQARTRFEQRRALVSSEVADNYLRMSNLLIARRLAGEAAIDSTVLREIARVGRQTCAADSGAARARPAGP